LYSLEGVIYLDESMILGAMKLKGPVPPYRFSTIN